MSAVTAFPDDVIVKTIPSALVVDANTLINLAKGGTGALDMLLLPRLCRHFEIEHLETATGGFWTLVEPQRS